MEIKTKTGNNKKEEPMIWGALNPKNYHLDKPIIEKDLGFYFMSENETDIDNLENIFREFLSSLNFSTFPIMILDLDEPFEDQSPLTPSVINRMSTVLMSNSSVFDSNIVYNTYIIIIHRRVKVKPEKKAYVLCISVQKPFPSIGYITKRIKEDLTNITEKLEREKKLTLKTSKKGSD